MGRGRMMRAGATFVAVTLALLILSPAVLIAGEWVNRHYHRTRWLRRRLARVRACGQWGSAGASLRVAGYPGRAGWLQRWVLSNPMWIALTAPGRWVADRVRPLAGRSQRGRGGGPWPPPAGDREPRHPRPDLPAGSVALPEPRLP